MIPLAFRDGVTDSELLEEEFRECDSCRAKPGTPALCGSCLQNRALIHHLQRVVRKSPLHQVKSAVRSVIIGFWRDGR